MIKYIYQKGTARNMILHVIIAFLAMLLILTQYFGVISLQEELSLDTLYYYNRETFFSIIDSFTKEDIFAYKLIHIADYFFIFSFYPFISFGLSTLIDSASKAKYFVLIPLFAGCSDLFEGISIDLHLYFYPNHYVFFGSVSGVFTALKFTLLYASIGLFVIYGVVKLIKKSNKKT